MWERKELKARGRAAMKANYWKCVLVAFLLVVFVLGTSAGASRTAQGKLNDSNVSFSTSGDGQYTVNGQTYNSLQDAITAVGEAENANPEDIAALNDALTQIQNDPETRQAVGLIFAVIGGVILVIVLIASALRIFLFNPLEVGCQNFFVRNAEAPADLGEIGRAFDPYGRNVGALLLRDIYKLLWSLLFIIPGIIKHYSYRMVPYILADHPEMSGNEAITLSRQMMDGQKWRAFVLDLSFIGWDILSALTLGLLGLFYVNPYKFCTNAELYHELNAQM
jgi:Predicted integral membrane protein